MFKYNIPIFTYVYYIVVVLTCMYIHDNWLAFGDHGTLTHAVICSENSAKSDDPLSLLLLSRSTDKPAVHYFVFIKSTCLTFKPKSTLPGQWTHLLNVYELLAVRRLALASSNLLGPVSGTVPDVICRVLSYTLMNSL
ncbi:hypothetical protein CBL_01709 [Carabus blaptoides fortunei]